MGEKPSKGATVANLGLSLPSTYEAFFRLLDGKDQSYWQKGRDVLQVLQTATGLTAGAAELRELSHSENR